MWSDRPVAGAASGVLVDRARVRAASLSIAAGAAVSAWAVGAGVVVAAVGGYELVRALRPFGAARRVVLRQRPGV